MNVILTLLGFVVIVALLAGVVRSLLGGSGPGRSPEEWPILVEAENSHEIYAVKGVLEQENVPIVVETESSEAGGLPTTLTRNRLRVPPDHHSEALKFLRVSNLDTSGLRVSDSKKEPGER